MTFVSLIFLLFFSCVFIIYCSLAGRFRWILLLGASYLFYSYWNWRYLPLLLGSTLVDYMCAIQMGKHETRQKRRIWLWLSLIVNLGVLFTFKYWNFVGENLNFLFQSNITLHHMLLPIGLSFYTLQTLGYSFDVYLGKEKPEQHLGFFSLYVCFFPQLVAGPIERSKNLLPQLKMLRLATIGEFRYGVLLIIWGFFLKLVIADNITLFIDSIFFSNVIFPFWLYWIAGALALIKIYCDFMGYSEIARGLAMLFGIKLTLNFRRPLFASTLREFWLRWHISLTRWIRDFIQIPMLKRFRSGSIRPFVTIFTLFVIGVWHGASWNFVLFGLLHGIILVIWSPLSNLFRQILPLSLAVRKQLGRVVLAMVLSLTVAIFYVSDSKVLFQVLTRMFDFHTSFMQASVLAINGTRPLLKALFGIIILLVYSSIGEFKEVEPAAYLVKSHSIYRWISVIIIFLLIIILGNFASENFVYFEF